jgi:putative nucleotidyltransferase with HDIG domain
MIDSFARLIETLLGVDPLQTRRVLHVAGVAVASVSFVLIATLLVAYDSLFLGANDIASLKVGDTAPQDVRSPTSLAPYISQVLTDQRKTEVRAGMPNVYFPPDPAVSRQQSDLAQSILGYVDHVRRDPYGTAQQKTQDLKQIRDLKLDEAVIAYLLQLDDVQWADVRDQITSVLERVMRGEIREDTLLAVVAQLPIQVSVRFDEEEVSFITAVIEGLIRPNTRLNEDATETAREEAAANVVVRRSFERGQIVVRSGERIDEATYEAFEKLGLLESVSRRMQELVRALMAGITLMVVIGLYIARFKPTLFVSSRFMLLLATIFIVILLGARMAGSAGQIYLYPTAALALLYVALAGAEVAVIGTFGMAAMIGLMQGNSLEMALLVGVGGIMATLTLRRPERLNGYFMPGVLVALTNVAVIVIFFQGDTTLAGVDVSLLVRVIYGLLNGIFAATVALGGIYVITVLFNLPTGLKLVELSQPNQPLLQRLLREAPGTYQHSLQVANLSEQAASAISANADLVRVAAMYHDVGKMLNAAFFTENQAEGVNPHDTLNDPVRSAAIIISHVTDGDKIARQYRLPSRLREFILEHHGTQVLHFYQQALARAGSGEEVDEEQFRYPGPAPQSRETAILMLADSCEAAVRSRKPTKKQDIVETVGQIVESKIKAGQLDESGLTLNDISTIRRVFADMLQAVFHPRINYPAMLASKPLPQAQVEPPPDVMPRIFSPVNGSLSLPKRETGELDRIYRAPESAPEESLPELRRYTPAQTTRETPVVKILLDDVDESPLPTVPPLPRAGESRGGANGAEGTKPIKKDAPEEQ